MAREDKGILYRQNFGGGADMGGVKGDTRAANTGLSGGYQGGERGGYGRRDSVQDRDRDVGVTTSAVGTLADPREKQDYFGSTIFGPSRKYTGSFLDNILGGGYRAVQPYAPDQFQSRLSQAGGFGKSIFGGILGLLNPLAGIAYRIGTSLPSMRGYDTLADYAKGEFGLFQRPGVSVDQGRGSGLRSLGITPEQVFFDPTNFNKTAMNLQGVSPTEGIMQVAGLTDKQKKLLDQRRGMYPDILGAQEMLDNISSEDDPNDPATIEDIQKYYGVV